MHYYSTTNRDLRYSLREAILKGIAPDRGLFMPHPIPILSRSGLEELKGMDLTAISVRLSKLLFGDEIPEEIITGIAEEAVNFDTPLVRVEEGICALELFHGPTLAFKDVGARFLARLLGYYTTDYKEDIHVLVATSGDTGSAVANGFLGVPGVRVHVLYPSGLVTPLQEKQFATLDENVSAVEVEGTFDDCQTLVKEAFMDPQILDEMILTSANSINLARFLPQAFYYFRAWAQIEPGTDLFFSVPSGNYGNLMAGLMAREMGLPVHTFLSANNRNDVVPYYLQTGRYEPRPSVATIANAMDVGDPSNFQRILDLFDHRHEWITEHLHGFSYSDREIRETIRRVYQETGYLCDPHGATGYQAARDYLDGKEAPPAGNDEQENRSPADSAARNSRSPAGSTTSGSTTTGIFLETAHPAKFKETVEEVIQQTVELPARLAYFVDREKKSAKLKPDFREFKAYLLG